MTAAPSVADLDRTAARGELLARLASLADRGHVAPCLTWPDAGWTADDLEEQQLAASLCHRCPAVKPCRAYGLEHLTEYGAYGALTEADRHQPTRRSKTKEHDHA